MRRLSLFFIALGLVVGTAVFYYLYTLATDSQWRISAAEAREKLARGYFDVVLDVRTLAERQTLGFYPNSIHIPAGELATLMPLRFPETGISILVYCNTGHRARLATDKLHDLGYVNAQYISSSHLSILGPESK
jgi:rhodanese-related sulfurtransferase